MTKTSFVGRLNRRMSLRRWSLASRSRRVPAERGAAAVELGLASLVLIPMLLTGSDFGVIEAKTNAVATALRSAAIQGLNVNSKRDHDHAVITSLIGELKGRGVLDIRKIIIFEGTGGSTPPSQCLTTTAESAGGVLNVCNVYTTATINLLLSATDSHTTSGDTTNTDSSGSATNTYFSAAKCAGSLDQKWCPTDRSNDNGWSVGIYVETVIQPVFGILPTLRNRQVNDSVVVRERRSDDDNDNMALGKSTWQSCTAWSGDSSRAVDGITDGNYGNNSVTHTCGSSAQDYWAVDLGGQKDIGRIEISNRIDCCSNRLDKFSVVIANAPVSSLSQARVVGQASVYDYFAPVEKGVVITMNPNEKGRYVYVWLNETNALSLAEVQVFKP